MAIHMKEPIAFLSYVRDDDKHDNGRISQVIERLSAEIKMQTGREFPIFQDRNGIKWGQNWKTRIEESIDAVSFFIPIITPSYFQSPACCDELLKFFGVQSKLDRTDLILPIYYVTAEEFDDPGEREQNEISKILFDHQYKDWRELRFKPLTDPMISQALADMAAQVKQSLKLIKNYKKDKLTSNKETPRADINAGLRSESISSESKTTKSEKVSRRRTEIPTVVVDAMHRGDYPSITKAIEAVKPGTRILVRPGLYNEGITIDKPLEIIGDGDRSQIIVQVKDKDIIEFKTSMGKLSNLTLKQLGGDFYSIDIGQGRLDIEECDITSLGLAIIGIHDWADPRIRRNIIHGGKGSGIFVYENGQGTIEDNDITNNVLAGVEIKENSNPLIRKNRIYGGKGGGIMVHANGQGTIEDNDITSNTFAGIEIKEGANPLIRKNRISGGKGGGLYVHTNGQGTIEDNDIFDNTIGGIEIKEGGNPLIRKNRISNGKESGVFVWKSGLGTIEDNYIFTNTFSGIEIKEEASPLVKNNRIKNNLEYGIYIHSKGKGHYEGNKIENNKKGAWYISEDSVSLVTKKNNIES